jgi:hypothetical protein
MPGAVEPAWRRKERTKPDRLSATASDDFRDGLRMCECESESHRGFDPHAVRREKRPLRDLDQHIFANHAEDAAVGRGLNPVRFDGGDISPRDWPPTPTVTKTETHSLPGNYVTVTFLAGSPVHPCCHSACARRCPESRGSLRDVGSAGIGCQSITTPPLWFEFLSVLGEAAVQIGAVPTRRDCDRRLHREESHPHWSLVSDSSKDLVIQGIAIVKST